MPVRNLLVSRAWMVGVMTAAAVAAVVMGQGVAPEGGGGGGGAASVEAMVKSLDSSVYAERERAHRELMALPYSELDALGKAASTVTDAETVLRLREVMRSLESIEATTTPLISLDVKDVTYAQLGEALARATGVPIAGDNLSSDDRFTLSVKDKTFWETIDQLSLQHPMSVAEREALTLKPRKDASVRYRQTVRGVLISVGQPQVEGAVMMRVQRNVAARPTSRISISVAVAVDPRIIVYQTRPPVILSGSDDLGGEITPMEGQQVERDSQGLPAQVWDRTIDLYGPEKPGTTVTLKGNVSFAVEWGGKAGEATLADKQLNEAVNVGELSITLKQVASIPVAAEEGMRAAGIKLEIVRQGRTARPPEVGEMRTEDGYVRGPSFARRAGAPLRGQSEGRVSVDNNDVVLMDGVFRFDAQPPVAGGNVSPLEIVVLDKEGKEILSRKVSIHSAATLLLGTRTISGEPAKIVLRSGTIREVTVPFEFKDLPLKK